jgi:peptide-methionine (R)-S-oxide reductase
MKQGGGAKLREYSKTPEAISRLTAEEFRVTQQGGTELRGTGGYLQNKQPGIYVDIVSGEPLFASSRPGWKLPMRPTAAE